MFNLLKSRCAIEASNLVSYAKKILDIDLEYKKVKLCFLDQGENFFESSRRGKLYSEHKMLTVPSSDDFKIEKLLLTMEELLIPYNKITPEKRADFLLKYISNYFPKDLYLFLNSKGLIQSLADIDDKDMRCHTMVHGEQGRIANELLFKINAPQFRMGNGGVWFVNEDEAEDLVSCLKIDAKSHRYSHRLGILDFRPLSESDGFTDRSGIKLGFEQNLSSYIGPEDLILNPEFTDSHSIHYKKAFSIYRSITYVLRHEEVEATPENIRSCLDLKILIDMAFLTYAKDKSIECLRSMLKTLPGFKYDFDGYDRPSQLKQSSEVRQELSAIVMNGLKFFSIFENLISSHAKDTITFSDIIYNNMVIIAILPKDNDDASKMAMSLFRKSMVPHLGMPIESLTQEIVNRKPERLVGFRPCIFGHSVVSQIMGMVSISAQLSALGFASYRFDEHFSNNMKAIDEEYRCAKVSVANHLFLPGGHVASYALHLLKSEEDYLRIQGIGITLGRYLPESKTGIKPLITTKYNDIAFFTGGNFALQFKL